MSKLKIPSIPEPSLDIHSIQNTILQLKEAVEIMSGQRGGPPPLTWDDLVRLGLIEKGDIPR